MKNLDIKQILKLNEKFYQLVSNDFSRTRQRPWKGWSRVAQVISKTFDDEIINNREITVLDIGCGNGRFYGYLKGKIENITYTGLDTNNDLLQEACKNFSSTKNKTTFINFDAIGDISGITGKYNVIVAFGLTHHIPVSQFRNNWFKSLPNLMDSNNALLILTFWEFEKEPGDYLLSWSDNKEAARFCHRYSDEEISEIIKIYDDIGIKLLEEYQSDNENLYLIFGNI
jgi:SAM-dependent methyltransferase